MAKAGQSESVTNAVVAENQSARIVGLDTALAVLAVIAIITLFFTGRIPTAQPEEVPTVA
jgi:hypothetical protein